MTESVEDKPKLLLKSDWYQTEAIVVITVMVKNIKEEHLKLEIKEKEVNVIINHPDYEMCTMCFNLSHKVVASESTYRLSSAKIEIKLKKCEGIRWEKLESDPAEENVESAAIVQQPQHPPSYPTSKKGKDWSAIEKDIKEQEAKEKPEGEEAINKLFQEIYGKGSDEVKRAMNKSYMESGGTVLSTNWEEISKNKVEVKPPDGMEFKKWDD